MPLLRFFLVVFTLLPGLSVPAWAGGRAVIAIGLTAGETQAARLQLQAKALRNGFLARGLTADAITVLGASGSRLRREQILEALKNTAGPASAGDETWLVLLGTAGSRGGEPSFQVSGPRLTATELTAALAALPGRKCVVVATTASGGFLPPLLAVPEVEAVAATADSGEINEPRFAEAWAEALLTTPQATFAELAASAATRVEKFYEATSLAQGEHARLIERSADGAGRIIEAPFAKAAAPAASPTPGPRPVSAGFSVADIEIPRPSTDTEIERRPATDETRALLAEARAAAKDVAHAAIFLRIDTELTVGSDFTVLERHRTRAYLRTGEALDELGTLLLPSHPPAFTTRLEGVRVLTPDGAQVIVNPRSFDARRAADQHEADEARAQGRPDGPAAPPFLPLPEVTAGCIVEAAWTVERRSSGDLPEFSEEWFLAQRHPVRVLHLSVTTPATARWRTFAPHLSPVREASTVAARDIANPDTVAVEAGGAPTRTLRWTLADLPAYEPLPGDPPARAFAPWVGVSSLASWDAFAAWYRRISAGSAETGPAVAALVAEIARSHPDRAGRLRAAYEHVSALRYVAIELGVGAFRPRTPEQVWSQRYGDCKDKAGLLVAVLGRLGIPAEFALVNRFDQTFTAWPAWQFNHALARVPADPGAGQQHDLWLDTTDRLVPFGLVAPGDLGRQAFAFGPQGAGTFHEITAAQEPPSRWKELWSRHENGRAQLTLGADGAADIALRRLFLNLSPAQRARRLQSLYPADGFVVKSLVIGDPHDLVRPFAVQATVQLRRDTPPVPCAVPGLAAFFATETIARPVWWDEGRATQFVHADGTLELPAGPVSPEAYPALRARWLEFTRPKP